MRGLLSLLILAASAFPARAETCPVLEMEGPVPSKSLSGYIAAYPDPDWHLDLRGATREGAANFQLIDSNIPDFGYTESRIWLRLCLQNMTPDVTEWRLYTHENFFQVYAVYVVRADGTFETITNLQEDSAFSSREIADPELVSPFDFAPGERITLYVSYWSGGSSQVDFSLQTKASYDDIAAAKTARNFFFYGMMILLITVALISLVVFRHVVFLAYCAYSASALLFVMHGDGVAFQFLWPNLPLFNSNASIVTGSALIIFGAIYARIFLRTKERHPRIDKVLIGLIGLTVLLDLALYARDPQLLKQLLVGLSLLSFLIFTVAGVIAYAAGYREVRFYMLAWLSVVISSLLMNLRHFFGVEIPQNVVHDSMRAVMVLDAMMMGLAIADRYNQLRLSRQFALQANLTAAQNSLSLNRRLAELQTQHELAVEMAKSRDTQIQNVVHDLRQPLHALRLNVMNLNDKQTSEPGGLQRVESSFDYLEGLIAEHLDISQHAPPTHSHSEDDRPLDDLSLQSIIAAVQEMFLPDARAKGLTLKRLPSRLEVPVNALVLTRILSNLVSNAIKYTSSGGVLIGTRQRGETVRIEVHDSGSGMTEAEFNDALKRHVRLEKGRRQAEGQGIGLSLALDLAQRHGMRIERSSLRKSGTGVVLVIARKAMRDEPKTAGDAVFRS